MPSSAGLLAVEMILAAFAGGALGAAIGALPSFSLAGLSILLGQVTSVTGGNGVGSPGTTGPAVLTSLVGLGPALGPHVAFAGGVAATAYASRKGYIDSAFEYHEAKHITMALGTKPDVLVVGGVFGVFGYFVTQLSLQFRLPWNPIFASVVLSAFVHRLVLGYPILGRFDGGLLDMRPFERGERRTVTDGGTPASAGEGSSDSTTGTARGASPGGESDGGPTRPGDHRAGATGQPGGRLVVEPWLPHQYQWPNVAVLGLIAGLFGAFVSIQTGSYLLAFGLAVASLAFLCLGLQWVPVTHHVVLPAGIVALALPNAAVWLAMLAGAAAGVGSALIAELAQRVLYAHADTHLDPAAVAIVVSTFLIALLEIAGIFSTTPVPVPV